MCFHVSMISTVFIGWEFDRVSYDILALQTVESFFLMHKEATVVVVDVVAAMVVWW